MKKVLSTKTLSADLLLEASKLHLQIKCIEVIETGAVDFEANKMLKEECLIFTSANAVKYFFQKTSSQSVKSKKVYAIGANTCRELNAYNIAPINVADNAKELADIIVNEKHIRCVLHVCGNLRLNMLQERFTTAGIDYNDLVVYQTNLLKPKVTERFDAVMFYSPSGVESFFSVNDINAAPVFCCIGETTASAVRKLTDSIVIIAKQPSPIAMATVLAEYFKKLN